MKKSILISCLATIVTLFQATTLQAALREMSIGTPENNAVIRISAGTYAPIDLRAYEGLTFTLQATGEVIIDGEQTARCAALPSGVTLDGFTLRNGVAEEGGGVHGGRVLNCTIENCSATLGGGAYETACVTTLFRSNRAAMFGSAVFGGTVMSCVMEANDASEVGGTGTIANAKVANTTMVNNQVAYDVAGTLMSDVANMLYYHNTLTAGVTKETAYSRTIVPINHFNGECVASCELTDENASTVFKDVAQSNWDIKTSSLIVDQGDNTLGGYYDALWYAKDSAGRSRLNGTALDLGAYELPSDRTYTVSAKVIGAGSCTVSPSEISEGERVTYTAQADVAYPRDFLGFYLNNTLLTTEQTFTYRPTYAEATAIEARFASLTATPETLADVLANESPTATEIIQLTAGNYTLPALTSSVCLLGPDATAPEAVVMTVSGDLKGSTVVGMTVKGTATNVVLHRVIADGLTATGVTATSTYLKAGSLTGAQAANITVAYGATATFDQSINSLTLAAGESPILPKGSAQINAGSMGGVTPYDALDLYGRPRVLGGIIDRGANECEWVTVAISVEGAYTSITPAVGTYDELYGTLLTVQVAGPRAFLGWQCSDRDALVQEMTFTTRLTANFSACARFDGLSVQNDAGLAEALKKTLPGDIIQLGEGTYTGDVQVPVGVTLRGETLRGGTTQADVCIEGPISGAGRLENVTIRSTTVQDVTLNRVFVAACQLQDVKVYNSILQDVTQATGTYAQNTTIGTVLPADAIGTRALDAVPEDNNYALTARDTDCIDQVATLLSEVGDLDYYGQPRKSGFGVDLGAVEWQAPDYTVTVKVVGHGIVSPRGTFTLPRGESFTLIAQEDAITQRTLQSIVDEQGNTLSATSILPTRDNMMITVTFAGVSVSGGGAALQTAIDAGCDDELFEVAPGTYSAINTRGRAVTIRATNADPALTIIDGCGTQRVATLSENGTFASTLEGITLQNGLSTSGAGALGGTLVRCIVRDNNVTYNGIGAGLRAATAINCLLIDNGSAEITRSMGGGAAESTLINCTVVRNIAQNGAGLYECTATNTIVALNVDATGTAADWYGETVPDPTNCCGPIDCEGCYQRDPAAIFVNPRARGEGWEMVDWTLRADAVDCCLDTADATALAGYTTDLLGQTRCYGSAPDMGALEWANPPYQVTIDIKGRGFALFNGQEISYQAVPVTVSVDRSTMVQLGFRAEAGAPRELSHVLADGVRLELPEGSTSLYWEVTAANTLQTTVTYVVQDAFVTTDDALQVALSTAIAGEIIHVAPGTYSTTVRVPASVSVEGTDENVIFAGGAELAEGAVIRQVTFTQCGVKGGSYERCTFTAIQAGPAVANAILKNCLVVGNTGAALVASTAYLSTIVDSTGCGADATSKLYGSVVWGNTPNVENGTLIVDTTVGGTPGFRLPAPDGTDYQLLRQSGLIDVAGSAQWEGFTDADRAMKDRAGNVRPSINAYDRGAFEYQGTTEESSDTWWWYGSDFSADGAFEGASWRQSDYGQPQQVIAGDTVLFDDLSLFHQAQVSVGGSTTVGEIYFRNSAVTAYELSGEGQIINDGWSKIGAGLLTLAAPMTTQGGITVAAGTLTIADGARIQATGKASFRNTSQIVMQGGQFSANDLNVYNTSTLLQTGGEFNCGSTLSVRNDAKLNLAGGTFNGGCLSLAISASSNAIVPVKFTGATVNFERIESGDENGARYGDVEQYAGTVTLTGTGSGKSAPLHISHWSASAKYTLKGGVLNVPNGEVRLGQDGSGTLLIEGGQAYLKKYGITSGKVQISGGELFLAETSSGTLTAAGGTVTAQAKFSLSATTQATTETAFVAETGALNLTLTGTGIAYLKQGTFTFASNKVASHLKLGEGVVLECVLPTLSNADAVLTLPGTGIAPSVAPTTEATSDLTNLSIAFTTMPTKDQKTLVLQGSFTGTPLAKDGYTFEVASDGLYVTRTEEIVTPETSVAEADLTLTMTSGSYAWNTATANAIWQDRLGNMTAFTTGETACVVVPETADAETTLVVTEKMAQISELTFKIAEGKTLLLSMDATLSVDTLTIQSQGTLALNPKGGYSKFLSYTTLATSSGTIEVRSNTAYLTGSALATTAIHVLSGGYVDFSSLASIKSLSVEAGGLVRIEDTLYVDQGIDVKGNATFYVDGNLPNANMTVAAGTLTLNKLVNNTVTLSSLTVASGATVVYPTLGKLQIARLEMVVAEGSSAQVPTTVNVLYALSQTGDGTLTIEGAKTFESPVELLGNIYFNDVATFNTAAALEGTFNFKQMPNFATAAALRIATGTTVTLPFGTTLKAQQVRVAEGAKILLDAEGRTLEELNTTFTLIDAESLVLNSLSGFSITLINVASDIVPTVVKTLEGDTLKVTIQATDRVQWQGASAAAWSQASNWSGAYTDEAALAFAGTLDQCVTLDKAVSPTAIQFEAGAGVEILGDGEIKSRVQLTQATQSTVVWSKDVFPRQGNYTVAEGAIARILTNDLSNFATHFYGKGTIEFVESSALFQWDEPLFEGALVATEGSTLTFKNPTILAMADLTVGAGANVVLPVAGRVQSLTLEAGAMLVMTPDQPLTVEQAITLPAEGQVTIALASTPTEEGAYALLQLPENATISTTTFLLDATTEEQQVAVLGIEGQTLVLHIYVDTNIAWASQTDGMDTWVINQTTQSSTYAANKTVWFNDVASVTQASVTLPQAPASIHVTASETTFTLSGKTATAVVIDAGAQVIFSGEMPTSIQLNGQLELNHMTVDLTQVPCIGKGTFIVGEGGVLKATAEDYAIASYTVETRGSGQLLLVIPADETLQIPANRMTQGLSVRKVGEGTLTLPAATFSDVVIAVDEGSLIMPSSAGIRARYVKFEAYGRYAGSGSGTTTGIADFAPMLNGTRIAWPENTKVVRFDSGVSNSVQIGISNDAQNSNGTNAYKSIDGDPATEFTFGEWHATYNNGMPRLYEVIDLGEDVEDVGFLFDGYNLATPSKPNASFYKWDVAVADDISNWRPATTASSSSMDTGIWKTVDSRERTNSTTGLSANTWITSSGYTIQTPTGTIATVGAITLADTTTLDLTRTIDSTAGTESRLTVKRLAGSGKVLLPLNGTLSLESAEGVTLAFQGDTLPVGGITLKGQLSETPITFDPVIIESVRATMTSEGVVLFADFGGEVSLIQGFDTTLYRLEKTTTTEGLQTVRVYSSSQDLDQTTLRATVSADSSWRDLRWYNDDNVEVSLPVWDSVQTVILSVASDATVSIDATYTLNSLQITGEGALTFNAAEGVSKVYLFVKTVNIGTSAVTLYDGVLPLSSTCKIVSEATGVLTLGSDTILYASGGADYVFPNFNGQLIIPEGVTTTFAGGGGQIGQLPGSILVKGGTAKLAAEHVFGWKYVTAAGRQLFDDEVITIDGGTLDVTGSSKQYFRRTMVLKNGATLKGGTSFNLSRASRIKVSEGTATLQGTIQFGCDGAFSGQSKSWVDFEVASDAQLALEGSIKYANSVAYLKCFGGGTISTTAAQPYSIQTKVYNSTLTTGQGETAGSFAGALYLDNTSTLLVDGDAILTVAGQITGSPKVVFAQPSVLTEGRQIIQSSTVMNSLNLSLEPGYAVKVLTDASATPSYVATVTVVDYTALKATVSSTASWTQLEWTNPSGAPLTHAINWAAVQSVELVVQEDATLTVDTACAALQQLTFTGEGVVSLLGTEQLPATLTTEIAENAVITVSHPLSGTLTIATGATLTVKGQQENLTAIANEGSLCVQQGRLNLIATTVTGTGTLQAANEGVVEILATDYRTGKYQIQTQDSGRLALNVPAEATVTLPISAQAVYPSIIKTGAGTLSTLPQTAISVEAGTLTLDPTETGLRYRYIRWQVTATRPSASYSNTGMQISEFALYDVAGTRITLSDANVLRSGNYTANIPNSQFTKSEKIANLFDKSTGSKWYFSTGEGFTSPMTLVIDLGIDAPMLGAFAYATANDANGRDPYTWTLEGSLDGTTWSSLASVAQMVAMDRQTWSEQYTFTQPVTTLTGDIHVESKGTLCLQQSCTITGNVTFDEGATLDLQAVSTLTLEGAVLGDCQKKIKLTAEAVAALPLSSPLITTRDASPALEGFKLDRPKELGRRVKMTDAYTLSLTTLLTPTHVSHEEDTVVTEPFTPETVEIVSKAAATAEGEVEEITTVIGHTETQRSNDVSGAPQPRILTTPEINAALSVFEGIVTVTQNDTEDKTATALVAYDFGITVVTPQSITVKVLGTSDTAATFKSGITIKLYAQVLDGSSEPVEVNDLVVTKTSDSVFTLTGSIPINKNLTVKAVLETPNE